MAIQQNFPNLKPTLNLSFALTKALDPRIDFTRASSGRFYDGKTVAKAEENLLIRSQEFDDAYWQTAGNVTVTANTTTAPDGTSTAETMTEAATTASRRLAANNNAPVVTTALSASLVWTISCFYKIASDSPYAFLFMSDQTGAHQIQAWFKLSDGTLGSTATIGSATVVGSTITNAGDGWYRCTLTGSINTSSNPFAYIGMANADSSGPYAGDTGRAVHIWGAQLEQRSAVTAYTPTTTQPITNYIPVLQAAGNNVPRFDHNPVTGESLGLLIEEQRTNLLTWSEEFDNAAWNKVNATITADTIIAPDGTLTADKLFAGDGTFFSSALSQALSADQSLNIAHTFSVYLKAGEFRYARVLIRGGGNFRRYGILVDLQAGEIVGEGTTGGVTQTVKISEIKGVGGGWYRVAISAAFSDFGIRAAGIVPTNDNTLSWNMGNQFVQDYTGDGYSGIYLWGASLEQGAFPTSYIPTTSAQVTRSADAASMTGANFSSWYRADEGTVYFEGQYPLSSSGLVAISDGTTSNRIVIGRDTAPTNTFFVGANGVTQALLQNSTNVPFGGSFFKCSGAYKVDDFAYQRDGQSTLTDTSGTIPVVNQLRIGGLPYLSNFELNGCVRKLSYYPLRLSNTELVALTS